MKYIDISRFLFPYLVLNVIMFGSDENRENIRKEIMHVLDECCLVELKGSEHALTIFSLIDTLTKWVQDYKNKTKKTKSKLEKHVYEGYKKVEILINDIPKDILATTAVKNQQHVKAFQYYELYLRENQNQNYTQNSKKFTYEQVGLIQKYYSKLSEPDGLIGIATLRNKTSLFEQIIDQEISNNWSEAMHCYETIIQSNPKDKDCQLNMMNCLLNLGHLTILTKNVEALCSEKEIESSNSVEVIKGSSIEVNKESHNEFKKYGIKALWRLGKWDECEKYLKDLDDKSDFDIGLANLLIPYKEKNKNEFLERLSDTKKNLIEHLSASSMESYERSYPFIVKFQMLSEIEQSFEFFEFKNDSDYMTMILKKWDTSLNTTKKLISIREPILSLRRVIFKVHDMEDEINKTHLNFVGLAREEGYLEIAISSLLKAKNTNSPLFLIEQAKILYQKGKTTQAISIVESPDCEDNFLKAKMMLMAVEWFFKILIKVSKNKFKRGKGINQRLHTCTN
jgi:serine/threonine-protein kinase ATR